MGIKELLPLIMPHMGKDDVNVSVFASMVIAVDGNGWLHAALTHCAVDVLSDKTTLVYIEEFMKKVSILQQNGVKPYIVFDGRNPPSKECTKEKRNQKRIVYLETIANLCKTSMTSKDERELAKARTAIQSASSAAVKVTSRHVANVINVLRRFNVDFVVAPYEADAQIGWLCRQGIVHGAISNDSDMILYECPRVLYKMDYKGNGQLYERQVLFNTKVLPLLNSSGTIVGAVDMTKFDAERLRSACIMSGCDYLDRINGVSLTKAFMAVAQTPKIQYAIQRYANKLPRAPGTWDDAAALKEYSKEYRRACRTFRHQVVYDTVNQVLVRLTPLPPGVTEDEVAYAGRINAFGVDPNAAILVANGWVDPMDYQCLVSTLPTSLSPMLHDSFNVLLQSHGQKQVVLEESVAYILKTESLPPTPIMTLGSSRDSDTPQTQQSIELVQPIPVRELPQNEFMRRLAVEEYVAMSKFRHPSTYVKKKRPNALARDDSDDEMAPSPAKRPKTEEV